jgi:elongation factor Ts
MANIDVNLIKELREQTGAGIADCREALEEAGGNLEKATEIIKKKGLDKAVSKAGREVGAGMVETYSHGGKVGVLVEVLCETDFVAKTEDFKTLAHELALQVASMRPDSVSELLEQDYVRDPSQTVDALIKSVIGKLGENIQVGRFERIELGK